MLMSLIFCHVFSDSLYIDFDFIKKWEQVELNIVRKIDKFDMFHIDNENIITKILCKNKFEKFHMKKLYFFDDKINIVLVNRFIKNPDQYLIKALKLRGSEVNENIQLDSYFLQINKPKNSFVYNFDPI